jgi:hypothetical protein
MDDNPDLAEPNHQLQNLPNTNIVLVLGILSILCIVRVFVGSEEFWVGSILVGTEHIALGGVICGIISLVLARKGRKMYKVSLTSYSLQSFQKLRMGRVCSIIGLTIGGLFLLFIMIYLILYKYSN